MGVSGSRKVEKFQRLITEDADCHQESVSRALYRLERSDMLSIVSVGSGTTTVLLTVPGEHGTSAAPARQRPAAPAAAARRTQ